MKAEHLVQVHGLIARRGRFTLQIPHWELPAGCVVGVVGPNGAGKTTLLEILAGLAPRQAGEVKVLGMDPARHPAQVRAQLGFMSDDLSLFDLRIGPMMRLMSGYYERWDAGLVASLLERFELDPADRASQLSKGQGTRLRLVLALAFRPTLLVLDEPATGLDLRGRRQLLQAVLEVVRDEGRSVIVSSHQLADLERIADRLLVLDKGLLKADAPTPEIVGEGRTLEEAMLLLEAG